MIRRLTSKSLRGLARLGSILAVAISRRILFLSWLEIFKIATAVKHKRYIFFRTGGIQRPETRFCFLKFWKKKIFSCVYRKKRISESDFFLIVWKLTNSWLRTAANKLNGGTARANRRDDDLS